MEERKHIFEESKSNEKTPEPETTGMCEKEESEIEQALNIVLGIESEQTAQIQTMNITKERSLIEKAREFRTEFEAMKGGTYNAGIRTNADQY